MAWERLIMGGAQSFHAEKNLKKKKTKTLMVGKAGAIN